MKLLSGKEDPAMRHTLKIKVSKKRENGGVLACRQVTVREKFLRFLLGTPVKLTVLVPGDSVNEVAIREVHGSVDDPEDVPT